MLAAREIRPPSEDGAAPAGAPLVLIHGWAGSSGWWSPVIDRLGDTRHLLAVDLLSDDGAPVPPGANAVEHQAELLERTLAHHGIDEAVVVGHSMGGLVAVSLAERAPERVLGLVLIEIPPEMSYIRVNLLGRFLFVPVLGRLVWNHSPGFMARQGLGALFAPGFRIPDWIVREVRGVSYESSRTMRDALEPYLTRVHPRDQIERIGKPTVIVWGEQDRFWPVAAAAEYEGAAPIVRLPGVGHTPPVEAPERVIEEIDRLTASIPAAAP